MSNASYGKYYWNYPQFLLDTSGSITTITNAYNAAFPSSEGGYIETNGQITTIGNKYVIYNTVLAQAQNAAPDIENKYVTFRPSNLNLSDSSTYPYVNGQYALSRYGNNCTIHFPWYFKKVLGEPQRDIYDKDLYLVFDYDSSRGIGSYSEWDEAHNWSVSASGLIRFLLGSTGYTGGTKNVSNESNCHWYFHDTYTDTWGKLETIRGVNFSSNTDSLTAIQNECTRWFYDVIRGHQEDRNGTNKSINTLTSISVGSTLTLELPRNSKTGNIGIISTFTRLNGAPTNVTNAVTNIVSNVWWDFLDSSYNEHFGNNNWTIYNTIQSNVSNNQGLYETITLNTNNSNETHLFLDTTTTNGRIYTTPFYNTTKDVNIAIKFNSSPYLKGNLHDNEVDEILPAFQGKFNQLIIPKEFTGFYENTGNTLHIHQFPNRIYLDNGILKNNTTGSDQSGTGNMIFTFDRNNITQTEYWNHTSAGTKSYYNILASIGN